jgi:hypothetical protein
MPDAPPIRVAVSGASERGLGFRRLLAADEK